MKWLLEIYLTTYKDKGKDVVLMPVTICYDRILEMRNLAGEMISEEARDHSVMDIFNLLRNLKQD